MNRFEQYLQYRALSLKFKYQHPLFTNVLDHMIEAEGVPVPVQNVCAKLAVPLVERLETTLGLLSMSKRQFIEMALIDALDRADVVLQDTGALEALEGARHE